MGKPHSPAHPLLLPLLLKKIIDSNEAVKTRPNLRVGLNA